MHSFSILCGLAYKLVRKHIKSQTCANIQHTHCNKFLGNSGKTFKNIFNVVLSLNLHTTKMKCYK